MVDRTAGPNLMFTANTAGGDNLQAMETNPLTLGFVGVGAARCLSEHPESFIPPAKELHYFDNDTVYDPTLERAYSQLVDFHDLFAHEQVRKQWQLLTRVWDPCDRTRDPRLGLRPSSATESER